MDLQKLTFFTEGNTFTGSRTKDPATGALLRYLVYPDLENQKLIAYAWTTDVCFERAQERSEAAFFLSEQGLSETQTWLQEQYRAV